jgi:hypothetical protein
MIFKTKLSGFLITAIFLTGCASTREAKLIELYTNKLDPLIGRGAEEVVPIVTDQWEFELQSQWAITNPSSETVLMKNHRRAPFSKKEAEEIFREKGHYIVMILAKKDREHEARETDVQDATRVWDPPAHIHKSTSYVFVRFVFRDKKLHNYRCFRAQITG